jgi:uncharacterized protein YaaN involved in tellurite resistance
MSENPASLMQPAPMSEERRAEIAQLAAQIDLAEPTTILRFGAATQNRAQEAANAMLEGARASESGEAGASLSAMLATLRGFDATKAAEKPGFVARLFNRAKAEVGSIVMRYETVRGQIEAIGDRLDRHRTRLLEDVERLDRLYDATLEWFHALADHIAAGEMALARTEAETLPALVLAAENADDPLAPQKLRDARAARDELERRVHDLRLTRQVAMQALPSIRLIQENDKALAIHRMREAGRAVKSATDLTNELLTANAETLRRGNAEARVELERGAMDIEAVKRANAALVGTIEDSLRIAEEGRAGRVKASAELAMCEVEIRRALTAAKARAPQRG